MAMTHTTSLGDFKATSLDGEVIDLAAYEGQVVLVVNTASKCGFTPQYQGLQELYERVRRPGVHRARLPVRPVRPPGAGQRRGDRGLLRAELRGHFPMFSKIDVNGDEAHPLYQWLRDAAGWAAAADRIKWNFTKFLLGRDGQVIGRFGPTTKPREAVGRHRAGARLPEPPAVTSFSAKTHAEAIVLAPQQDIWDALVDPDLMAQFTPFLKRITADGDHWRWEMSGIDVARTQDRAGVHREDGLRRARPDRLPPRPALGDEGEGRRRGLVPAVAGRRTATEPRWSRSWPSPSSSRSPRRPAGRSGPPCPR